MNAGTIFKHLLATQKIALFGFRALTVPAVFSFQNFERRKPKAESTKIDFA
jgi:hypothetical protein